MISLLKKLLSFLAAPDNKSPHKQSEILKSVGDNQDLNDVDISFLKLLEGKKADDPSVLGWWCAFNNVDRSKIINKLSNNGYLTLADYKFKVRKATIPILKDFLSKHSLPAKGKKVDLINRIIENISEADCVNYFKQTYWALTPKSAELLRAEEVKAEADYSDNVALIRSGHYDALKNKMYPKKNEHWSTEDTFVDTIYFIMNNGFLEFGLNEEVRRHISSFVAARAIDYSSRGYSTCKNDVSNYLWSVNIASDTLKLPHALLNYTKENEIDDINEMIELYIQFIIDRARATAELKNYKSMGIKRIKVDALACRECRASKHKKTYDINEAPLLPLSWNCQCIYAPAIKNGS